MRSINIILFFGLILSTLFSCSEGTSPTNTAPTLEMADYFPSTQGSWWVYQENGTDSLGNLLEIRDSVYIGSLISMAGKEAITQISVKDNGKDIFYDTSYFYMEGSKLFVYTKGFFTDDESEIDGEWMPFIDLSKEQWQIYKNEIHIDSLISNPFIGDSVVYKQDALIDFTGYKNNNKTFTIKGVQINAKGVKFQMKMNTYVKLGDYEESYNSQSDIFIWFGKGIGMIFTQNEEAGIVYEKQELLDYYINH